MVIFIFLIIGLIIYFAVSGKHWEAKDFERSGGLNRNFPVLVDYFYNLPSAAILKHTSTSMEVSMLDPNYNLSYTFKIKYEFNSLRIKWKCRSSIYGDHSLSWNFPSSMSQMSMIETVIVDVDRYMSRLL